MKTSLKYFYTITLCTLSAVALLAAGPNPLQRYIQSISYRGTGTPQGTIAQSISNDRQVFTLIFDQFVASSGPGVPNSESKKDTFLQIDLAGANIKTTFTADVRGYVQLPAGMTAEIVTTLNGAPVSGGEGPTRFVGPVAKDYLLRDVVVGSSKNQQFGVKLFLQGSGQGQITADSIDGKFAPAP